MANDQDLSKFSDEHKAMLAEKCVKLLTGGKGEEGGADSAATVSTGPSRSPVAMAATGHGRSTPQPRRHGHRLLASPPMCVPEIQEKTHVKR